MSRPRRSAASLVIVLLALGLVGAAARIQAVKEAAYPLAPVSAETLYLGSGPGVRRLAVGYTALAADIYWIRALQHYGGTKLRLTDSHGAEPADRAPDPYHLLYPLLDITTTLDPRFNIAYRFGAIFLAEAHPNGAGRPDQAIALLQKGLRARPDKWEYMQDVGFVHYWWRKDYKAAAEWFQRASEVPGAPWWLRSLAATTLAEGGDRESSRRMWEAILESAEIDWLRNDAERRLTQLRALDQIDSLQQVVDRARTTGISADWAAITRARLLPGMPLDPSGTPYEIDGTGRVLMSNTSPLFPLPDEPQRMVSPAS
jgi:tetratricopeptide (TPR) repeat protein